MMRLHFKVLLGAGCVSVALTGTANAGGFSRGSADTDILFEPGNFNMRSSVTYVSPQRKFNKNGNPALVGTNYAEDYVVPSFAAKFNLTDSLRCAGTLVNNNGGSAKYASPTLSGKVSEEFTTYESALTCGAGFDAGQGKFWLLGGVFMEKFEYTQVNSYAAIDMGNAILDLDGQKFGYRIGAAYEIPDIALRGQVMYRSGTKYGADGNLNAPAGVLYAATVGTPLAARFQKIIATSPLGKNQPVDVPVLGVGELPQSVEFKLQSGIAPGWLAFGNVTWTDWSRLASLDVRDAATGTIISQDKYFWKDGWTVTGGVGHAFNDKVSGLVSLTWDQGVGTGWDVTGDTWTLAVGGSRRDGIGGEFRGGIGFSYLGASEETSYAPGANQGVRAGYAIALSAGYSLKW